MVFDFMGTSLARPELLETVLARALELRDAGNPDWLADILAAVDRTQCGPIAPADGLYLEKVDYD